MARARHPWILQQLVPHNQPTTKLAGNVPHQFPRQLVRTRSLERIGVVNPDIDHSFHSLRSSHASPNSPHGQQHKSTRCKQSQR